jgi:hypothetical protein
MAMQNVPAVISADAPVAKISSEGNPQDQAQKVWLQRIKREEKTHDKFRENSRKVEKVFRGTVDDGTLYVPLYWSVVGVEHVGVYSNQPVPDVRPRNDPQNPTFRAIATCIRRGLSYCIDHPSFDASMHRSVDDFLAMGLGTLRIKVDSIMNKETSRAPIMGQIQTPAGPVEAQVGSREVVNESMGDQTVRWEYVPWARFGWEPCNDWKHCNWIYFRHRMTALQIKKRFGRMVAASKDDKDRGNDPGQWKQQTWDIYEIWDKTKRQVVFLAKGESQPVQVIEDPLELIDFWPIPGMMNTNLPSEELIPKADYDYIKHYDAELNRLQERRMSILEQIKASGAYDKGLPELKGILELDDGEMMPIPNLLQRMAAAGGTDGFLWFQPITEKMEALRVITEQMMVVKGQVDEILGISDIVRGVTVASETATAQEIKGRWVGVRLTRKRETVIYTVKQMMRMMSQLLVSHITPQNLQRMTQMEITEEMMNIMQDDMLMQFIIDIESDSTIAKDEFKEKETFQEMLNGVAQFAQAVMPMVAQNQMPATVSSAILQAALKPYTKYDRNLEDAMSELPQTQAQMQQMNQTIQQGQQENQQLTEQMNYWQQLATMLQQDATDAKAAKDQADVRLKDSQVDLTNAKTDEIYGEISDEGLEKPLDNLKTVAEIGEIKSRTRQNDKPEKNMFSGRN